MSFGKAFYLCFTSVSPLTLYLSCLLRLEALQETDSFSLYVCWEGAHWGLDLGWGITGAAVIQIKITWPITHKNYYQWKLFTGSRPDPANRIFYVTLFMCIFPLKLSYAHAQVLARPGTYTCNRFAVRLVRQQPNMDSWKVRDLTLNIPRVYEDPIQPAWCQMQKGPLLEIAQNTDGIDWRESDPKSGMSELKLHG